MFTRVRRRFAIGATSALMVTAVAAGTVAAANPVKTADFDMQVSAGAKACLPNASAEVHIKSRGPVEVMTIDAAGLPPKTDFDLFVTQVPKAPFGVAWYQGDLETNHEGKAHGRFIGRFSIETFAVAPGSAPAPVVFNEAVPRRQPQPSLQPDPDVPPRAMVQLTNGCAECRLPEHRDAVQRRAQRRHPGPQHRQFRRRPGPAAPDPQLIPSTRAEDPAGALHRPDPSLLWRPAWTPTARCRNVILSVTRQCDRLSERCHATPKNRSVRREGSPNQCGGGGGGGGLFGDRADSHTGDRCPDQRRIVPEPLTVGAAHPLVAGCVSSPLAWQVELILARADFGGTAHTRVPDCCPEP